MNNVHATAQAVWDIRRLVSWIRSLQPDSPIGLYGLSLGGYVASLVASLEQKPTCAILGVPVADLIDVLTHHAALGPTIHAATPWHWLRRSGGWSHRSR